MTYIKDLFNLPDRVHQGDFVLRLTEGVSRAEETVNSYVVTPQLVGAFDEALSLIRSAIAQRSSKAAYLNGSFGSGKSHFMAVLGLILQNNPHARALLPLAPVIAKHNEWTANRRFLIVPYHLIGAESMESAIFSGYVEYVRRAHPKSPLPGVYRAEHLFQDAKNLRATMGDATFFAELNQAVGAAGESDGWGEYSAYWQAERFDAALQAAPRDPDRLRLVGDLTDRFFTALRQSGEYVDLDTGLAILSHHARQLGYDALILFLDELILWLASRAADFAFVSREGQKLAKLVEAQSAERPVPLISFVARQRDLKELVGEHLPGAQKLGFSDVMKHSEGRFSKITLENGNLPAIAAERLLKPKSEAARQMLEQAFKEIERLRPEVLQTLLTSQAPLPVFRQVYPFSPALVETLVAVSSLLQRERTALRVMLQLLVSQRETLKLGEIIPVGDLFDIIAEGDEAFTDVMKKHFEDAKKLYYQKLRPLLEREAGLRFAEAAAQPADPRAAKLRSDDRLVKTLLLAALCPNVESFRGLNASRLAALNHGAIKTPIAGHETQEVLRRARHWAAEVGAIKISSEPPNNPTITVQLTGIDTQSILDQVASVDNYGNRVRKIKDLLFRQFNTEAKDEFWQSYEFTWRATRRTCGLYFGNVYEMTVSVLTNHGEDWLVVVDYPFDSEGRGPRDDLAVLDNVKRQLKQPSRAIIWLPSFFSLAAQDDLGTLVRLDYLLTGERFENYVTHLPAVERPAARSLLDNQRSQLRERLIGYLQEAYGLEAPTGRALDETHKLALAEQFQTLDQEFPLQPPVGANLEEAFAGLLDQALNYQYPAHPLFEMDAKLNLPTLRRVADVIEQATQVTDGRLAIDAPARRELRLVANPLKLGEMHETHFLLGHHWTQHFARHEAEHEGPVTVGHLRAWLDQPKATGLPREVQNLVIVAFATQASRSFFRNGIPLTPALDNLPDDAELREQTLPEALQWNTATRRGAAIFGITVSPLLNATNVAKFVEEVKNQARRQRLACDELLQELSRRGPVFGEKQTDFPRWRTAHAVSILLEQMEQATPSQVVPTLAQAAIATSEAAMNTSCVEAQSVADKLRAVRWALLEALSNLTGDSGTAAASLWKNLHSAFIQDEYVVHLAQALKEAEDAAAKLLTEAVKTRVPAGPEVAPTSKTAELQPKTNSGKRRSLARGQQQATDITGLNALLEELRQQLAQHEGARVDVTWEMYQE